MITIGRHSYLCEPEYRGDMNNVTIGNFTSIAQGCVFDCGFNHNYKNVTSFPLHRLDEKLPSNIVCRGDIVIGNDVWIGEGCMIMAGVTIGDGAVIGAKTIVTKSVEPFTVLAGKKAWTRFDSWESYQLQTIAWWNWGDEQIINNAHLLLSEDIKNFIENHE